MSSQKFISDFLSGINAFQDSLLCGICLEPLNNPVRTKCGHRFCNFCILKALDAKVDGGDSGIGRRQTSCPSCKAKGVTKRSLTKDQLSAELVTALGVLKRAFEEDMRGCIEFGESPYKFENVVKNALPPMLEKSSQTIADDSLVADSSLISSESNCRGLSDSTNIEKKKRKKIVFELKGKTVPESPRVVEPLPISTLESRPYKNVIFVQLGRLAPKPKMVSRRKLRQSFPTFSEVLAKQERRLSLGHSAANAKNDELGLRSTLKSPICDDLSGYVNYSGQMEVVCGTSSSQKENFTPPSKTAPSKSRNVSKAQIVAAALKGSPANVSSIVQGKRRKKTLLEEEKSTKTTKDPLVSTSNTSETSDAKTVSNFTRKIVGGNKDLYTSDEESQGTIEKRKSILIEESVEVQQLSSRNSSRLRTGHQPGNADQIPQTEISYSELTADVQKDPHSRDEESATSVDKEQQSLSILDTGIEAQKSRAKTIGTQEDVINGTDNEMVGNQSFKEQQSQEITTDDLKRKLAELKESLAEKDKEEICFATPKLTPGEESDDDIFESTPEPKKSRKRPSKEKAELQKDSKKSRKLNYEERSTSQGSCGELELPEIEPLSPLARQKPSTHAAKYRRYSKSPDSLILVTSGLSAQQRQDFEEFRKKFKVNIGQQVDRKASIVVVGCLAEKGRAERTLKFLQAIAFGKLVVSMEWIYESQNEGFLLEPLEFEVKDERGLDGPKSGRLRRENKERGLFANFEFVLKDNFKTITREKLRQLIVECGGRVIRSQNLFSYKMTALVLVDKETKVDAVECRRIFEELDVAVVDKDWLIECIATYSIRSLMSFLAHKATVAELTSKGYDNDALLEVSVLEDC